MMADFFTKPLEGTTFVHVPEKILNLPSSTSPAVNRSVLDNQNYEKDQINGLGRKDKQNGPDRPKISKAVNRKVSDDFYGTKISPREQKSQKHWT